MVLDIDLIKVAIEVPLVIHEGHAITGKFVFETIIVPLDTHLGCVEHPSAENARGVLDGSGMNVVLIRDTYRPLSFFNPKAIFAEYSAGDRSRERSHDVSVYEKLVKLVSLVETVGCFSVKRNLK